MSTRSHDEDDDGRPPPPRAPLPAHSDSVVVDGISMTHDELVNALRAVDGLVAIGGEPPSFQLRSRPFLHFHDRDGEIYADVRFGNGDFEPVWASTPLERIALLGRVCDHVERLGGARKTDHRHPRRPHRR